MICTNKCCCQIFSNNIEKFAKKKKIKIIKFPLIIFKFRENVTKKYQTITILLRIKNLVIIYYKIKKFNCK